VFNDEIVAELVGKCDFDGIYCCCVVTIWVRSGGELIGEIGGDAGGVDMGVEGVVEGIE
jgi:hypothetical protein